MPIHIADAIHRNQSQNECRLPAIAANELGKRLYQRALQPRTRIACRRQFAGHGFGRQQHGQHTQAHGGSHHQISGLPGRVLVAGVVGASGACRNPQHPSPGPNHGESVAGLVGGGQCGLVLRVGRFNAKGVQRNVLGGGAKGHQQREPDHRLKRLLWVQ